MPRAPPMQQRDADLAGGDAEIASRYSELASSRDDRLGDRSSDGTTSR